MSQAVPELVEKALAGDRRSLSRLLSLVENGYPEGREALRLLYPRSGRAHVVGITGAAGSGKSTLIFALAQELRRRGRTVGVVAVDPTSPFSQGALLGDRVRMQALTSDPGVFIRSMASRGALGGLAPATMDVVTVLDACGTDAIIVETVGAGQDEVQVMDAAHTVLVVTVPGTGDEVQAIKAGILEIAHILVVNKADLPRADILANQLAEFVNLDKDDGWRVPIVRTVAIRGDGVAELADAIEAHRRHLATAAASEQSLRERARRRLMYALFGHLWEEALRLAQEDGRLEEMIAAVARRELDPYTAARRLAERPSSPAR
ncbi:MAG TPA: methylmalonyl Co-A mutase-associated GTPase MeaB [Dehalococcoidia bacterium]|nr:methylmalonyl Co-A mutase-associated GTPase MeaB [Dehalococcoidia bacterium]